MIASTITIPVYSHPHFLWAALHSLVEHSFYHHRIIVLWSDPNRVEPARGQPHVGASDFETDHITHTPKQSYKSLENLMTREAAWLTANHIEMLDVTAQTIEFRAKYIRENGRVPEGGATIAFQNNLGLQHTTTEWTIPNWDADFYAGWHWDRPIFDHALSTKNRSEYLIPMHCQPALVDTATWDPWRDAPKVSVHRLTIPAQRSVLVDGKTHPFVTRDEVLAFQERWRKPGETIREPCGARRRLHWVPWILRTDDIRAIGGFNLQGSGYDLAFDDTFAQRGFTKIGFCDSFIVHKGFIPQPPTHS